MCGPATPPGPSYLDLETTVTDLRALLDAANEARERAEQVHSGCDAQVRALVTKALAAIRAQEAAESRAAAAEKERDEERWRAASLSRELLYAMQARDSYRASAELRVGMRREFEELLGCGDTTAPETFEAGLVRLRALLDAEAKAERLAKAAKKRLAEIPHHDEGSCRRIDCGDCALRAVLAEVGK